MLLVLSLVGGLLIVLLFVSLTREVIKQARLQAQDEAQLSHYRDVVQVAKALHKAKSASGKLARRAANRKRALRKRYGL